jgi:hypothetical protein
MVSTFSLKNKKNKKIKIKIPFVVQRHLKTSRGSRGLSGMDVMTLASSS